jgi:hypothetical protein
MWCTAHVRGTTMISLDDIVFAGLVTVPLIGCVAVFFMAVIGIPV